MLCNAASQMLEEQRGRKVRQVLLPEQKGRVKKGAGIVFIWHKMQRTVTVSPEDIQYYHEETETQRG